VDADELIDGLRAVCVALPEVTEKISHGTPSWFVRKMFASYVGRHHGDEYLCLWVAAPEGAQEEMVTAEPDRFFVPPYVGHRGWVGVRLDRGAPWDEIAGVIEEAYLERAPKTLRAALERD